MKKDFNYLSRDGATKIHGIEWKPEGEIRAVLQICHGMVEYIDRYDEFARYLNERGYYVVGHDHLGHGDSVNGEADYGYFPEDKGNTYIIGDIHQMRIKVTKQYPDVPYFILGHSMGSFLVRQYIKMYGDGLAGVIIMGTGDHTGIELAAGKLLCRILAAFRGWHYRSNLVNNMAFGAYNKKFQPARTDKDWLSKDTEKVDAYIREPRCNFVFTVAAYHQMFTGMQELKKEQNCRMLPKTLPVFFVAGADDPVGNFGKSVKKVYQKYVDMGMQDVKIKLYETDRHEILNEVDRETVFEDLYQWLEEKRQDAL